MKKRKTDVVLFSLFIFLVGFNLGWLSSALTPGGEPPGDVSVPAPSRPIDIAPAGD